MIPLTPFLTAAVYYMAFNPKGQQFAKSMLEKGLEVSADLEKALFPPVKKQADKIQGEYDGQLQRTDTVHARRSATSEQSPTETWTSVDGGSQEAILQQQDSGKTC